MGKSLELVAIELIELAYDPTYQRWIEKRIMTDLLSPDWLLIALAVFAGGVVVGSLIGRWI